MARAWSRQTLRSEALPIPVAHHCADVFEPCHHFEPTPQPFSLLDNLKRVPTKCWNCLGSGKCQQDYPGPGSGKGSDGGKEYYCGGSGKCYTCAGSGWIYTRTVTGMLN